MKQINLILAGGLGNQMFQYAAARALQLKYDCELHLSTYFYDKKINADRALSLRPFAFYTDEMLCSEEESERGYQALFSQQPVLAERVLRKLAPWLAPFYQRHLIKEGHIRSVSGGPFGYYPIEVISEHNVMFGGFQSPKFFAEYTEEIQKDLQIVTSPKEANLQLMTQMRREQSVCVHVRRGDYLAPEFRHLDVCTQEYYQKAMRYMLERLEKPVFYVFSNTHEDIEWIRLNWEFPGEIVYVDMDNCDYEELQVMYQCRHFIIANSTFSWWAQFLSDNADKIVCAPPIWDASLPRESRAIYEENWVIVE